MMKTKWKENVRRLLAGILAGSLLLGMAGCKSGTQDAQDEETAMGRYLEEEINLPEGLSKSSIRDICLMGQWRSWDVMSNTWPGTGCLLTEERPGRSRAICPRSWAWKMERILPKL